MIYRKSPGVWGSDGTSVETMPTSQGAGAPRSSGAGPAQLAFDKGWASNLDPDVLFSVGSGKFKEDPEN